MYEKTLVLLKPDAVQRRLVGKIIESFEECGLKFHGMRLLKVSRELAEAHYAEHKGKDFFSPMVEFICSEPVIAIALGGGNVIEKVRLLVGGTEPAHASISSIRGRYAHQSFDNGRDGIIKNLVHASDSLESAERELKLWFSKSELLEYQLPDDYYVGL